MDPHIRKARLLDVVEKDLRLTEREFDHLGECSECQVAYENSVLEVTKTRRDDLLSLRTVVSDSQAERLREALRKTGLAVVYQEEQRGPTLVIHMRFSAIHEGDIQEILREFGLSAIAESPDA